MFFLLSKIGFFFLQPSNAIAFIGLFGIVAMVFGWRRFGVAAMASSILLVLFLGLSPAANWLMEPLEQRFARQTDMPDIAAIIVLGGSFDTRSAKGRGTIELNESAERLTIVPALARQHPDALIVHSGGHNHVMENAPITEADGAERIFADFGLDPARIILEGTSRNTYENAVFTKEKIGALADKPILLVTSAYHMPRSVGIFRQVGFAHVIPYPVDFRVRAENGETQLFSGVSSGLKRFDTAFREWVGMVVYWATGRSASAFPAP